MRGKLGEIQAIGRLALGKEKGKGKSKGDEPTQIPTGFLFKEYAALNLVKRELSKGKMKGEKIGSTMVRKWRERKKRDNYITYKNKISTEVA